jgi:hypothetical protein
VIQMLAVRYKLDQSKIIEQIHEQWRELKTHLLRIKSNSELLNEKISDCRWSAWI